MRRLVRFYEALDRQARDSDVLRALMRGIFSVTASAFMFTGIVLILVIGVHHGFGYETKYTPRLMFVVVGILSGVYGLIWWEHFPKAIYWFYAPIVAALTLLFWLVTSPYRLYNTLHAAWRESDPRKKKENES